MLVRFDPKNPEGSSSEFLIPTRLDNGEMAFTSLKSERISEYGLVIFTGRDLAPEDVFAKLVDSGKRVLSVEKTMADINAFLEDIALHKVGSVLKLVSVEGDSRGFRLENTKLKARSSKPRSLP